MKNIRFDLVIHWIFAIIWALLAISGFSMISAQFGWVIDYNFILADKVHRIGAAAFVFITFISIIYEILQKIKKDKRPLPWFVIGRSGYQLFTFIVSLLLILSGALIWICMELNMKAVVFAIQIHEYISYIALISVIWHIFQKAHILLWPKKKVIKEAK